MLKLNELNKTNCLVLLYHTCLLLVEYYFVIDNFHTFSQIGDIFHLYDYLLG